MLYMDTGTNWNKVFAHSWSDPRNFNDDSDVTYDALVRYLIEGASYLKNLSASQQRLVVNRARFGYRVDVSTTTLVLNHSGPLPWLTDKISNRSILPDSGASHHFRVVRPSKRKETIRLLLDNVKDIRMNQHTLFDAIFRKKMLGVSRRYIQHALNTMPEFNLFRISKTIPVKPVIKSFRPERPFDHWQMDFIDLNSGTLRFHNRGYGHVLVIIDIFTKFVYLKATKSNDGLTVANILHSIFLSGDVPRVLHSDNGAAFISELPASSDHPITVKSLCEEFNVIRRFGAPYSPQTQGFVENKNKYIKKMIYDQMLKTGSYRFYDQIERVAYAINNTKHSVTKFTPMQLHRGREAPTEPRIAYEMAANFQLSEPTTGRFNEVMQEMTEAENFRTRSVRTTLHRVADKRESKQIENLKKDQLYSSAVLKVGMNVLLATYQKHKEGLIQPTILRAVSTNFTPSHEIYFRNPLRISAERVHVTKPVAMKPTVFFKHNLKTHAYYIKKYDVQGKRIPDGTAFVSSVVESTGNRVMYRVEIVIDNRTYSIQRKVMNGKRGYEWSNEFHRAHLMSLLEIRQNRLINDARSDRSENSQFDPPDAEPRSDRSENSQFDPPDAEPRSDRSENSQLDPPDAEPRRNRVRSGFDQIFFANIGREVRVRYPNGSYQPTVIVGVDAQKNMYLVKFDNIFEDDNSGNAVTTHVPTEDVWPYADPWPSADRADYRFSSPEGTYRIDRVVDKSQPPRGYVTPQRRADYGIAPRRPAFRIRWLGWGEQHDDWVSMEYLERLRNENPTNIGTRFFSTLTDQAKSLNQMV
jgi:hypothetical protein